MKKILITGANGLLGQKLVTLLHPLKDVELIATGKGENRFTKIPTVHYLSLDITNPKEINEILSTYRPQIVIHTAAMTQVDDCETQRENCWILNVKAVEYLIEACQKLDIFFIHLSTDFIFDGLAGPYDEKALPNPISYYGESKWEAEKIIQKSSIRWAIVRTVLVYGVTENMSRSNIILWVKKSLENQKTIQVVDDQWRTPTLAEDLAVGCWLIAEKEAQGIFNISGKDFLTPYEMAIKTADFFKLDTSFIIKTDGSKFQQVARRPPKTGFIIQKAVDILGYQPHSFEEGIALLEKQMNEIENT